jgi:hypothetical protein
LYFLRNGIHVFMAKNYTKRIGLSVRHPKTYGL